MARRKASKSHANHFTGSMQTEAQRTVNGLVRLPTHAPDGSDLARVFELHIPSGARKFLLRQGLWIEDLQTPPGQECSNGSMILLAVVLWRAFLCQTESLDPAGPAIPK